MSKPQSGILPEANSNATFLVFLLQNDTTSLENIRQFAKRFPALVATLQQRFSDSHLSATLAFGSNAWEQLFQNKEYPAELTPFKALRDGERIAPSTPGDILVHIRSERRDVNFEFSRLVMEQLNDSVIMEEEITGFRYLDKRDMTGFVDGTENPTGEHRATVALVPEDQPLAGGSYINCQRYIHNMPQWNACPMHQQEQIIGRTKEKNIEFARSDKAPTAHIKRVNLKENGQSLEILRHSMPYGNSQENGLFFIAYARTPRHFNLMLEQMIHADDGGHYDHLLNYTHAVSGNAYFAPSLDFLDAL